LQSAQFRNVVVVAIPYSSKNINIIASTHLWWLLAATTCL
jgi:uncharacterized membrane protein